MRALPLILVAFMLTTFSTPPPLLEQIQQTGRLRVVTRASPITFYAGPNGPQGFEYEIANRFAVYLGVALDMYVPADFPTVLEEVANGNAHIAAAGFTITEERSRRFHFGPSYMDVTPQVIYRYGDGRPRNLADLAGGRLVVLASSRHAELLQSLAAEFPGLEWEADPVADSEELLYRVHSGEIDYTVADSTEFEISRNYYPEIRSAFDLGEPEPIAWVFSGGNDPSLRESANAFFTELADSGELDELIEQAFGHADRFDYVGTRRFLEHIDSRLPRYREFFERASEITGFDWRLLAAIGYQESHWNPRAVSPTGVRGIMMLTQNTARMLGVENRIDPKQSILGGARYLVRVRRKIPDRIPEPDRTWMALASYNVGYGHLEDARILTETLGGDPDRWADVRDVLPLLAQKKYHSKLARGYARGHEPVIYVDNIRSYYDILQWATSERNFANVNDSVTAGEGASEDEQEENAEE